MSKFQQRITCPYVDLGCISLLLPTVEIAKVAWPISIALAWQLEQSGKQRGRARILSQTTPGLCKDIGHHV